MPITWGGGGASDVVGDRSRRLVAVLEIGLGGATVDKVTDAALTGVAKARTGDVAAVAITRAAATLPAIAAALGTAIAARKVLPRRIGSSMA